MLRENRTETAPLHFPRPAQSIWRSKRSITGYQALGAKHREGVQFGEQKKRNGQKNQHRSDRVSPRISWSATPVLPVAPRARSWSSFPSQRSRFARNSSVDGIVRSCQSAFSFLADLPQGTGNDNQQSLCRGVHSRQAVQSPFTVSV
jgi:hypothetical protein